MYDANDPNIGRFLNHLSLWGGAAYPVRKVGRSWHVDKLFGLGGCPTTFKTKREAVAYFERFYDGMRNVAAGRDFFDSPR